MKKPGALFLVRSVAVLLLQIGCIWPARAQTPAACGPLQIVNTIQMTRAPDGSRDFVPILFEAGWKNFLFDTGGARTAITFAAAQDMKLPLSDSTTVLMDFTGHSLAKMARINEFVLGHLKSDTAYFPVLPGESDMGEGIFALDYLLKYDADVDFGTDKLNFFSQNHCAGRVVYWQSPAVAVLPMTVDSDFHILVPVVIDGQQFDALIDSGATITTLRSDVAESKLHLTLGDSDTPKSGTLSGPSAATTYRHVFKSLTFCDVAVTNPRVTIIAQERGTVDDRMGVHPGPLTGPIAVIGMDVLRKLHIYMAFKESKLYISAASEHPQSGTTH